MLTHVLQINMVIWRNDATVRAPLWCDISVKARRGLVMLRAVADGLSSSDSALSLDDWRQSCALQDFWPTLSAHELQPSPDMIVVIELLWTTRSRSESQSLRWVAT